MNHTVAVTGGTRATGKTTSVAVLGAVFADAGADVLLVDCDLTNPTLAAALGIPEPDATLRDVFAGHATLDEAVHTGPAGAVVLPGGRFAVPDAAAIRDFVDTIDGFDVVVCDTGDPFSDATAGACDAADGVIVVSTLDNAAQRNTAAVHESLRKHGRPLLGTVLTRAQGDADTPEWDCDIFATIPESDAVASGAAAVLDSPSDPGAERYRELARGVYRRLREGHDGSASNDALWLPRPADPFLTPAVAAGGAGDADASSNDEPGEPEPAAGDDTASDADADGGNGSTGDTNDSTVEADTPAEKPTEDDDGGFRLTRRGALAALTAAVGGVSAGILNTRETPTIEGFGYGGAPVTSTDSGAANATNDTTDAGSISAGGVNRTEQTTELVDGGSDEDPTPNETETGAVDNTTDSGNVTNTTDSGNVTNTTDSGNVTNTTDPENTNTTDSGNVTDTTDSSEELTPTQDSDDGSSTDTDGSSPTNGGSTGTGDGTTTDDGSGNETGTGDGSGGDDTTDETSPSEPGDEFGTVGYGQGGYGGVA